jgi:hypothetical protein
MGIFCDKGMCKGVRLKFARLLSVQLSVLQTSHAWPV